ncbi:MAG: hypothetical protein AAGL96_19330 [Pseudomonadota bacterium]
MVLNHDDRCAMEVHIDRNPWQHLPEMAETVAAERAGIDAGLSVLEIYHLHAAEKLARHQSTFQQGMGRLHAAVEVTTLRADIARAMK